VQDRLLGPKELEVDAAGDVLVYRVENQAVDVWGCRWLRWSNLIHRCSLRTTSRSGAGSRIWSGFAGVCGDGAVGVAAFCPLGLSDNRELDPAAAALNEQHFARLAIPAYPLWAEPGGVVRWFTGPDVLLRDDAGIWLWVRARTTLALDAVRTALPGEWLMLPDR
jgi:hypothetical protein